ncbi:MAG: 2-hydroxyacyl-CoA dehydratase [Chloroflexi bacterium]|nr:2-hydroxyacyl-CoA dehydratase [Chloroflexota bacterium]
MEALKATIEGLRELYQPSRPATAGAAPLSESGRLFYRIMADHYQSVLRAREEGRLVAMHSGRPPLELLHALDIVPFYHEIFSLDALALQRNLQPYLEAASTAGIPVEFCSNHRAMVGQALTGAIPDPDLLLLQTDCCDNKLKTWEIFFDHYDCPRFLLDIPFTYREEGIAYIRRQLDQLVSFLEAHSGKKLDLDRLTQSLEHSRQCHALYREINRMRAGVPSPLNSREAFSPLAMMLSLEGTPEAVSYFQQLRDDLQERVAQGKGAVEQENYRLFWLHGLPLHSLELLDWFEREHGAVVVMDQFSLLEEEDMIDPARPLESLARRHYFSCLNIAFYGDLEKSSRHITRAAREARAQGAVFLAHIGCQIGCTMIRYFKDALQEEVGIPTLILDADLIDPTAMSLEEMQGKMEGFFEILDERKGG